MVDTDSVLLNVQERDKWRRRMEVLERSLRELQDQRRRVEGRLRRVRKDLLRLQRTADAVLDIARRQAHAGRLDAAHIPLTYR
jgi:predicted  nucleic acid-binding Zn-ribbon protein